MKVQSPATASLFAPIRPNDQDRLLVEVKDDITFTLTVYSVRDPAPGMRFPPIAWQTVRFVKERLTEAKQIANKKGDEYVYEIPITDNNIEIIHASWSEARSQLLLDGEAKIRFQEILLLGKIQDRNAELVAKFRDRGMLPLTTIKEHEKFPLAPYQQLARHCILGNPGFFLFGDPGTGKTAPTISAICEASKRKGEFYRALIICPNAVRYNWEKEFAKFATVPYRVTVIRGDKYEREKLLITALVPKNGEQCSVVICSFDSLIASPDAISLNNILDTEVSDQWRWDMAVVDEAHWMKTPTTSRAKAAMRVRDKADVRVTLTGTPFTKSLFDIWSQFEFLGQGFSGFATFKGFKSFYGSYRLDEFTGRSELVDFKNIPLFQERLARLSFRMTKELDLGQLPEKVFDTVECSMAPKQMEMYKKVATQITVEINQQIERDALEGRSEKMTIQNVLTKMLRLSQVTSGFIKSDDEYDNFGELVRSGEITYFTPNRKLDRLIEILKSDDKTPDDKTIIWAVDVPAIRQIRQRLRDEGLEHAALYGEIPMAEREEEKRRFNCDYNCKVFVGNPLAGGIGINLLGHDPNEPENYTTDATHVIHYSMGWRPDVKSQADDRAHRRGSRKHVRITDLVVPGTIDEEIRERVQDKQDVAVTLSDLKKVLQRITDSKVEIE